MGFEIVDRRGGNKEVEPAVDERLEATGDVEEANRVSSECGGGPAHKVTEFKRTVRGEVQGWKDRVWFVVLSIQIGQGQVMMCRAVGIRTDEVLFTADYAVPPLWVDGDDFAAEAKKRLETFKGCSCGKDGRCKFHGEALPGGGKPGKWLQADIKRLQGIQSAPLPEAVEVLMKMEQEGSRIIVPR